MEQISKYALHGGSFALLGLLSEKANLTTPIRLDNLGSITVPFSLALFVGGVSNSIINDVVHDLVKNEIDKKDKFLDQGSMLISLLTSAGVANLVFFIYGGQALVQEFGMIKLGLYGTASEILAYYGDNVLYPKN